MNTASHAQNQAPLTHSTPTFADAPSAWKPVGSPNFGDWSGLKPLKVKSASPLANAAEMTFPGVAVYHHPAGQRGWYSQGLQLHNDSTADWWDDYGLTFEIFLPAERNLELTATLKTMPPAFGNGQLVLQSQATTSVTGNGWQRVTLPWSAFDFDRGQNAFLKFIQELHLTGRFCDGKPGKVRLRNIRILHAAAIGLDAPVRGKAPQAGQSATYQVTVGNSSDKARTVQLSFQKQGWETMQASVAPARVTLAPGTTTQVEVTVTVPTRVPPGGHEVQHLVALAQGTGDVLGQLELVTACDVPRPSIMHTPSEWAQTRDNVRRYEWAKKDQDEYIQVADQWKVPEAPTPLGKLSVPENHTYVFQSAEFATLEKVSVAWQLTRNRTYAEKVALFLRRLSDPRTGYPFAKALVSQDQPQEGENMQRVAIAYDAILDSGVLTETDRTQIETTFRLYMRDLTGITLNVGNVGNWSTAMGTGALFCALAMGDLSAANRYIYGPTGVTDYLSKGIMDDGWWWEGSTSYNLWVSAELTQSALATRPWGIDLLNLQVTASYSPHTIINPMGTGPQLYGIKFETWGPFRRNTRSIKDLWDALPAAVDYRGIILGVNDGHEERVAGPRIELAYYAFRDPRFAALIKLAPTRDLVYGVPDLPADTPLLGTGSHSAENVGFSLLRSQTPNRPAREQIQAALKFGSHGGYHGHFDRASLLNLTRYGRSFYNPESIWHGYASSLYKFYVQTSLSHNMVVVDGKQQEATEPNQPLFYTGKMLQACAVETTARWSDPPYGGMVYQAGETLEQRQWSNRQSYPIVSDRKWGELGPYSEPILQRRLLVVTDDYIVLADYLKGEAQHTFDNLFQMKALQSLEAPGKTFLRHDAQYDANPHSSGQFITDADWYSASAPAVSKWEFRYGAGTDNEGTRIFYNEDGTLKVDVHTLWPPKQEIMVAQPPETHGEPQSVSYTVKGDGKVLTQGKSGVWVLGQIPLDVPVGGVKELTIELIADGGSKKALFLADARLVTAEGKETLFVGQTSSQNIEAPQNAGQDYYGGPIKIAGVPYANAIPLQPQDAKASAILHIPLAGLGATRFKAVLGGDYPFGDEAQRRKVYGIRTTGTKAHFLSLMEPYENASAVKTAVATGPDTLRVELNDGLVQDITIKNLDGNGKDIQISIVESKDGKIVRSETTGG